MFFSKPLIKQRMQLKIESKLPENTIISSSNIHYTFDVPKFGQIDEISDLRLQDIRTIDVIIDLPVIANLGAVRLLV